MLHLIFSVLMDTNLIPAIIVLTLLFTTNLYFSSHLIGFILLWVTGPLPSK